MIIVIIIYLMGLLIFATYSLGAMGLGWLGKHMQALLCVGGTDRRPVASVSKPKELQLTFQAGDERSTVLMRLFIQVSRN
ncbi:hypothetical protein D3C78_1588720 [compost metagenome]